MKPKKKKTKKLKSSSLKRKNKIDLEKDGKEFWSSPAGISIIASAQGKPDPYAVRINVFSEAKKVKNFKQLERFFELYAPGVTAADAAEIVTRHIKDSSKNWNLFKILKDPEYHSEVFKLLHWIDTKKGGAPAAYEHRVLKIFAAKTGYKIPPSIKTFQNELTFSIK